MGMSERSSFRRVILVGAIYFAIGLLFSSFTVRSGLGSMVAAWRVIAWLVSGGVFLWHIWGERVRLGRTTAATALSAAAAVAIAAFGLGARVAVQSAHPSWLAPVVWPIVAGIPAFAAALAAGATLQRFAAARAVE